MRMRDEDIDGIVAEDEALRMEDEAYKMELIAERLINVLEAVFKSLQESVDSAERNCSNSDASVALYELSSAFNAMDIPYTIKEALGVPHTKNTQSSYNPHRHMIL